jgi:hypothetical protein
MDKALEERIKSIAILQVKLDRELAQAISQVLKKYDVTGKYIFNVRKDADYCHKPITSLKGRELIFPMYCLGSGATTVETPEEIFPI